MANFYEPTVLTTSLQTPPVYTGSAETDIIYQIRGDIPSGNVAYTWCDNPASQELCDQHYVAFTSNNVTTQGVVCHETGHAVGLTHGAQADPQLSNTDPLLGCMQRPTSSTLVLGAHNTQIINSTY